MRHSLKPVYAAIFTAVFLVSGCAIAPKVDLTNTSVLTAWRGRLAVRIEADQAQPQSFSASFELSGNAQTGELTLFTPLGTTAATLAWSSHEALMHANGNSQHFQSLDDLIRHAVGTDIPVAALFAWLAGEHMNVKGWHADLSQHASGRVTARRTEPAPIAELRLVLEK